MERNSHGITFKRFEVYSSVAFSALLVCSRPLCLAPESSRHSLPPALDNHLSPFCLRGFADPERVMYMESNVWPVRLVLPLCMMFVRFLYLVAGVNTSSSLLLSYRPVCFWFNSGAHRQAPSRPPGFPRPKPRSKRSTPAWVGSGPSDSPDLCSLLPGRWVPEEV